jgi:hypothetical protein
MQGAHVAPQILGARSAAVCHNRMTVLYGIQAALRWSMTPEREKLKKQYGLLFDAVAAVLFQYDLMGIGFGDNTDEYEPETGTILPRLAGAKSVDDVQTIVYEEFCRWFDADGAGAREKYGEVSVKTWEAWRAGRGAHDNLDVCYCFIVS